VVFYTDGIVETQRLVGDESWEEFGVERLLAVLRKHRDRAAADIVRAVFDDVERFSGRRLPRDDRTIVVVKRAVEPT
jgi:sigma-B regulation protein RsbU (phosphoserine phosphatase)